MPERSFFNSIKSVVEETDTPAGRAFDLFFQALIIFSIASYSLETLPSLGKYQMVFDYTEFCVVILFTIEYMLRITVTERKAGFVFSFYGVIDFLAIAPFYLSLGSADLRVLRIFRLMRLLRIFKLGRYSTALVRLKSAFIEIKQELIIFSLISLIFIFLSSVGLYHFEHEAQPEQFQSVFHSMWCAIATLTTVGYGDIYPVTLGGKIFTFIILMIGLAFISIPSGLLASALSKKE